LLIRDNVFLVLSLLVVAASKKFTSSVKLHAVRRFISLEDLTLDDHHTL
jgi:hypothetical protein